MEFKLTYAPGATLLDPDEINGLIPKYISTQNELNILEQSNILSGKNWGLKYKKDILNESFVRALHKKMYEDIWTWAGQYRLTQKSIGIDAGQISTQLHALMKDVQTWIELESYKWPEILARFHHRLVWIHPFANGNGRYARLHTDFLATRYNQDVPSWGELKSAGSIDKESHIRELYISALRLADQKQFNELIQFLYL